jgi:hypothetical protein
MRLARPWLAYLLSRRDIDAMLQSPLRTPTAIAGLQATQVTQ